MPFTPRPVLIAGVSLILGGKPFVVPALTLGQLDALEGPLAAIGGMTSGRFTKEGRDGLVAVVHAALTRNYPDATADEVRELLDLRTAPEAIEAVLAITGLEKKAPGQGEA